MTTDRAREAIKVKLDGGFIWDDSFARALATLILDIDARLTNLGQPLPENADVHPEPGGKDW